ncbi:MAG: hypothetical protein GTN73_00110 [Candidatus Aminicenantes bacterium]|nr:hypothetical protein [Candidatus Aminicenantes bacterium]
MLVLKHVEYEISGRGQLESLISHLRVTTSKVDGVTFNDIYFKKNEKEFILFLECGSEEKYLEWREICPPPPGAKDWYEVLMSKDEYFS